MTTYNDSLSEYISHTFAREDEALRWIREEISARGLPEIMISAEEAAFLRVLVAAGGAERAVEVGTHGGYSGTWIARALPEGGRLTTIELLEDRAELAREAFARAGVAEKIDLRVGDANEILPELEADGPCDFVFIDADKEGYPAYLDWALDNLSPGGLVAAHNAFAFGGQVADSGVQDRDVEIIRQVNRRLAEDPRLTSTIFPAGDGIVVGAFAPDRAR